MLISTFVLAVAILLSIAYAGLGFAAFLHVNNEQKRQLSQRLLAITLWWPFYDMYDEKGRQLSRYGKGLLPLTAMAYILWVAWPG